MARPSSSTTTPHAPVAPIAPASIHALATPTPTFVDASMPGYLLPIALDALAESAGAVVARRLAAEQAAEGEPASVLDQAPAGPAAAGAKDKGKGRAEVTALVDSAVAHRMERIGAMVGGYIAEKLTSARPPLATHLDMIKFVCKDLFLHVYRRQIDNLRTNHRGVYVLQSHIFPPIAHFSSYRGAAADLETAKQHLVFPQALIQGALARLGMQTTVTAETSQLPQCTFQIRTVKSHPARQESMNAASALASMSPRQ